MHFSIILICTTGLIITLLVSYQIVKYSIEVLSQDRRQYLHNQRHLQLTLNALLIFQVAATYISDKNNSIGKCVTFTKNFLFTPYATALQR
jgi:hypothetical protein